MDEHGRSIVVNRSSVVFHRVCTVEELMMNDLISRKALYDAMEKREEMYAKGNCLYDAYNYHVSAEIVANAPSVPAVPLDQLCEWLAGWDIQVIPCNVCKSVFHLESCPHGPFDCGDSEHLKMLIRKWMEGLDAEVH